MGVDPARGACAANGRAAPACRVTAVVLVRRCRQESIALHRRAARWHLDGLNGRRPRPRDVRRRRAREQLREPQPVKYLLDEALQPLLEGRYRTRAIPRVREMVGW